MTRGLRRLAPSLLFALAAGACWELGARASASFLLPSASDTLGALGRMLASPDLWRALLVSNASLAVGLPLAVLAGVPVGLALGHSRVIERVLGVHLDLMLVTPKSALMPIVVMAFGFGLLTRAVVVALFAFPVIAVTMKAGVESLDWRLVEMARAFGARRIQIWRRVLLPGARPALATALRLGLARAVAGMISVELLLVAVGLGGMVLEFEADFDAASVYAVVLVVMAEAVLLIGLASRWQRRHGAVREDVAIE